ncbi:MAG TPA: hypothetical protein VFS34_00445 [Thermoanaerobaculia bacterium]|nr:hypothetical protein [Thermoanaerobaculia bacterium]
MVPSRIAVRAGPQALRIDIAPPISSPPLRRRLVAAASLLAAGTILGTIRLGLEWRQLAAGRETLPASVLVLLSAAVLVGAPTALFGLIALFFAEETLEIAEVTILREISIFGGAERRTLPRAASTRLLWTTRPVPPWWTWTFRRLALVTGPDRLGIGATLGSAEKETLERIVRRAIE